MAGDIKTAETFVLICYDGTPATVGVLDGHAEGLEDGRAPGNLEASNQ